MRILLFILIPLVFFGAGMLFASLLWGRYKQLSVNLRNQLERQAEATANLKETLGTLRDEHTAQTVTCHTLEEELANIATERQTMVADAAQARTDRTRLRRYEAECTDLTEKLEAHKERTQQEIQSAMDSLRAAENRANLISKEKEELLGLVDKLQSKLDQIAPLQRQLLNTEQQLQARQKQERAERLKARRSARHQADEPSRRSPRRRLPRTHQDAQSSAATKPQVAKVAKEAERNQINGSRPGIAKRVLSRLLPQSSTSSLGSRRHC